mgnify:CR=1 FL=1
MGKLLRVLVIILLVLSIVALVLGIMLFNKREILKGRTQKLEEAMKELASTIEDTEPSPDASAKYPERDTSPCTAEVLENPERKEFWKTYATELEKLDLPTVNLSERQVELMAYYQIDPASGKTVPDPVTGLPMTKGAGTMQAILDDLRDKSEKQYARLNKTRQQLKTLREELTDTINALNTLKHEQRLSLKEIVELKAEIERLKGEITSLKERITELEAEKTQLEDKITDLNRQLEELAEKLADKDDQIKSLKKEIESMKAGTRDMFAGEGNTSAQPSGPAQLDVPGAANPVGTPDGSVVVQQGQTVRAVPSGVKGTIASVNQEWKFVVIQFTDAAMKEMLGEDLSAPVPRMEFIVKRSGTPDQFVAKVNLVQIKRDQKLGIADILVNWEQLKAQKDDIVSYGN